MKNYSHYLTILLFLGFTISCNKTYDEPPVVEIPEGTRISISDLKDMFTGSPITLDSITLFMEILPVRRLTVIFTKRLIYRIFLEQLN